jgi:hypothetical protein
LRLLLPAPFSELPWLLLGHEQVTLHWQTALVSIGAHHVFKELYATVFMVRRKTQDTGVRRFSKLIPSPWVWSLPATHIFPSAAGSHGSIFRQPTSGNDLLPPEPPLRPPLQLGSSSAEKVKSSFFLCFLVYFFLPEDGQDACLCW